MRDILFRGKRKDNGEWVEGVAFPGEDWSITICRRNPIDGSFDGYEVDPASVGQYTGLTDKNGTKIFEGDIVLKLTRSGEKLCEVRFGNDKNIEVIGNIHDNPELLKGDAENE